MKRNQLTTYPSKDAPDLQQTLQHLKQLSISIFQHLPCSNRRETPTPPTAIHPINATAGDLPMKTIMLRIPAVEAARSRVAETQKHFAILRC